VVAKKNDKAVSAAPAQSLPEVNSNPVLAKAGPPAGAPSGAAKKAEPPSITKVSGSATHAPGQPGPGAAGGSLPDALPGQVAAQAIPAAKLAAPAHRPVKSANPQRQPFKVNECVVYPAHGVGQITAIEVQEVAGFKLELYVLSFAKDKMILKVPTTKAVSAGMRKLSDAGAVKAALGTLSGRARIKRTMWSRRAQEYEAKINSGDLNAIAEVVRDLYRSDSQPEQSYSERQLYEAALDRMAREIVAVQNLTETESLKMIEMHLQKAPRRRKAEESQAEEAEGEDALVEDADIDEAA
jgi:CarD family transcriptional regulator